MPRRLGHTLQIVGLLVMSAMCGGLSVLMINSERPRAGLYKYDDYLDPGVHVDMLDELVDGAPLENVVTVLAIAGTVFSLAYAVVLMFRVEPATRRRHRRKNKS